jgi:O-antigen ligase
VNPEHAERPIHVRRLVLYLVLLTVAAAAVFIFVPTSLVRLSVLGLVALPFMLILLDRPRWAFYIFLIILFSNIDIFLSFRFFRLVLLFLCAAFALDVVHGRRVVIHDGGFIALVAVFMIVAFQSLAVAHDLGSAIRAFKALVKVMINIALMVQFARNRLEFRTFILVVCLGLAINNFLPLVVDPPTRFSGQSLIWAQGVFRYEGFALEPNAFASLQIFFIPLLLYLIAVYRRSRIMRLVLLLLLAAAIFLLIISFSRSGFLSLAAILLILLIVERRNHTVLVAGLSIIAVGIFLAPAVYWERIATIFSGGEILTSDYAIFSRLQTMKIALVLGWTNPLTGVGLANFLHAASFYIPYVNVVHNAPLQVFSSLGFIGLASFTAIIVYNFRIIRSLMRNGDDQEAAQLGRILLVHMLGILVNSMFVPIAYQSIFWYTLALPSIARYAYARKIERAG